MHLVITDSGLGGLSICAGIEQRWRAAGAGGALRITYVNAWPEEGRGYNDLPDVNARATVFDRALQYMDSLAPDRILIACNTLSIVHASTTHRRSGTGAPVQGIVDAGVTLFARALLADAAAGIVLIGTRTTVDSGVHRGRLLGEGIGAARIGAASCHGLATAIEGGLDSRTTAHLIDTCADRAADAAPGAGPLFLGLCCTHYGMVRERLVTALARRVERPVTALDPNGQLVDDVSASFARDVGLARGEGPAAGVEPTGAVRLEVVSKVVLPEGTRSNVASVLEPISPETAQALRDYTHVPELF